MVKKLPQSMQRIIVELSDLGDCWAAWFDGFERDSQPGTTARDAVKNLLASNSNLGLKFSELTDDTDNCHDGHIECVPKSCVDCGGSGQYVGFTVVEPCRTCEGSGRCGGGVRRVDIVKSGVTDRLMFRMILERHGDYAIRDFEYADEYTNQLATDPDCIILGVILPDTDGLRLMSDLRRRGVRSPVVFATSSSEYEQEVMACGAFAFQDLSHLVEDEFVQKIERAVALRSSVTGQVPS